MQIVPFPAGRFLIDLPAGACVWFGRQGFNEAGTFAARYSDEHIELLVGFPSMPGVTLRVRTDTVGEVVAGYPPLLAREARRPRGGPGPGGGAASGAFPGTGTGQAGRPAGLAVHLGEPGPAP